MITHSFGACLIVVRKTDQVNTTPLLDECHNKEGWAHDSATGMCYLIVDTELSWNDARVECEFLAGHDRGGDLVSINSYDEQRYIMSKDTTTQFNRYCLVRMLIIVFLLFNLKTQYLKYHL